MNPLTEGWTERDVEAVIERNDPAELLYVPIVVSQYGPNCAWSESICLKLATHPDWNVRGNAILGFGHLARVCRVLDEQSVKPLIKAALKDPNDYVRRQAHAAVFDIKHSLGWRFFYH
jgi:HEAT repeats